MNSELLTLINACLDGHATDGEADRLNDILRTDPAARELYLQLADMHACLAVDELLCVESGGMAGGAEAMGVGQQSHRAPGWGRPFAAAVVGLLMGLCGASLVFAYVVPLVQKPIEVFCETFEAGPAPLTVGLPREAGVWSGDECEVVGIDQGVEPAAGDRMLRMISAYYDGKESCEGYIADVHRLIDLRPFRDAIAAGHSLVRVSAMFNAAEFPEHEAYSCSVSLYALDTATASTLSNEKQPELADASLAMTSKNSPGLDRDAATWQTFQGEAMLPPGTEFLLVRLGISHHNPAQRRDTFPGHYIDGVQVILEAGAVRQASHALPNVRK